MKLIHKRALSLLLSAALVLTVLPVTALAATTKDGVPYLDSNGSQSSADNVKVIENGSTELDSGWYMVDSSNVTISSTLIVKGNAKLILADGASLTVSGTDGDNAGISVTKDNSLSIYAQSVGSTMGKLTATGSGNGAGIGCNSFHSCGNISICGGRITATGGNGDLCAAGIGNVQGCRDTGFGTICIYGGIITATNGSFVNMPDIGGSNTSGDSIFIKGGTITSNWPSHSVSLGVYNDFEGPIPQITIDGGSMPIGYVFLGPAKNSAKADISQYSDELTIPGQNNAVVSSISINGVSYGNNICTDGSGKLYLNLPVSDGFVPIVVTMSDGSKYWMGYQPGSGDSITLVSVDQMISPNVTTFVKSEPYDPTVYTQNSGTIGVMNGNSALTEGTDYTVNGDAVTIKADYLDTLPNGVASLSITGVENGNSTLKVIVASDCNYFSLGDSIATGYGLPGYNPKGDTPATAYPSIVGNALGLARGRGAWDGATSSELLSFVTNPQNQPYLSTAKVITISIGSNDILEPIMEFLSTQLGCDQDNVLTALAAMAPETRAAVFSALNAGDGSGLKNNPILTQAASTFSQNFQGIISGLKKVAPDAKIYVTNIYNPYEHITIPYGTGTLDLGGIADGYIQTLNSAFSSSSPDYTLIDTHSAFSQSLQSGTSLVNADLATFNFDPHPNTAGHAKIANMILTACSGGSGTPVIQTTSLPDGTVSEPYHQVVRVTGSTPIGLFFISGNLPDGLTLNGNNGDISGTPTKSGTYEFTFQAVNALGGSRCQQFTLKITPFTGGGASIGDVTGAINQLTPNSTAPTVSGVVSDVLSLSPSEQAQLPPQQVAVLEGLMQNTLRVAVPVIHVPATSGFSGSAALPSIAPTVTGLMIAAYAAGAGAATLTTAQVPLSAAIPGGLVAFDLKLTEDAASQPVHSPLPFPVTVTIHLPTGFVPKAGAQYHINHTLPDDSIVQLPVIIAGTPGNYTATFSTPSFSTFTLVETAKGSSSGSSTGSSVTAPESGAAEKTFVSDTNADFSVNGAYQFKITSQNGIAPVLTVGTPGVFETQLVRTSGNDYFFKLTSVGKAGEKAGIYVNGGKMLVATVGTSAPPVKSDTTGSFKVAKGKTYTFKLTADVKPSFVCGNSSVFLVKFLRQSGKEYFYQVTAVGKPGQTAGFYLNAAKKPVAAAAVA